MALFQPTNITPDLKGGVKNGVILIPSGVATPTNWDISWSVNGNVPMTAYQIDFFQNNAASTQTGTTGKITLNPAFSAVSADGTETRYTATVAWSLISGTYSGTGTFEGKFRITMWWGSGANDYVEQRSLSVFQVSKEWGLAITNIDGVGGNMIFTGQFNSLSTYGEITLNWTRWVVYSGMGVGGEIVADTGKVWGATEYVWTPHTLAPGDYTVQFSAEQSNGAEISDSETFSVLQEDTTTVTGLLSVGCDRAKDAVAISFMGYDYIAPEPGTGSTTYPIPGNQFPNVPWHFIWHGTLVGDTPLFTITCKNGTTLTAYYNTADYEFKFTPAGTGGGAWQVTVGDEVYVCFTTGYFTSGVTTGFQWLAYSPDDIQNDNRAVTGYTQSEIVSVTLYDNAPATNFYVGFGTNNDEIKAGFNDPTAGAFFEGPQVGYPQDGYAYINYLGNTDASQSLYRQEVGKNELVYVGTFEPYPDPAYETVLYDYSAVNGKTYQYLVIENGEYGGNAAITYSPQISPCFWDWLLIEAIPNTSDWYVAQGSYTVTQVFIFSANVQTGSYTNRATRNVQPTFTPYPAVFRSTQNSRQGTLTGLIGSATQGEYNDSNATEAAIRGLSSSKNQLFLRDRRGNFLRIALAGEITMSVNDRTMKQEINASVPWVEIGPADSTGVFGVDHIEHVEPEP